MKILNFNSGFLPDKGGVATYSWELTRHLSKNPQVNHVQVIAFNISEVTDDVATEKASDKYTIIRHKRGLVNFWTMGSKIFKYLIKYKDYDIIHATNFFPIGFWIMVWTKMLGKKYFITIYGTDTLTSLGSKKTKFLKALIMKRAAKIFSISNSTTQKTLAKYNLPKEKFATITPGVTTSFTDKINLNLRADLGYLPDDFIILVINHLVARKGVDDVMRAVAKIDDEKIKLLIVGKGPERENLENLAKELNIANRIKFMGRVDEVESYYKAANILTLTSYYDNTGDIEGFGLVLVEAELRGLPVIGTNSGGIPETISDGVSGFIVGEREIEAIKEKILLLKNNPELYQKVSAAASKWAKQFDWTDIVAKHIEVYKK
ncbi:hypothetical protein COX27_01775 [Candidatus Kuenenbacteria bacterium CG23_combo_of_CG06-09_8_20_14_all_36_9]|uniref:Glycosyltransferase family 1 protein n=1 Tax=Candidatus Kuenenbacteria bacterium CG10_big_fil_rev_8_21_14_0_10_36_11 TaxID=1974618 RepID=A0A2M6W9S0_9BACT|nr:MAG: hypothetical protein COX27_01775 [Candidatus Kuenenbacteria bacterium CG23_combo_of_CG06-09_8_20_14_all_36_9]PIT89572.1 MAG: hypothetical protein COU23_03125 [Candidatus Kuenenbacteria bacterium CG10_big_fil_rev_8_21_14_0_10_36_11]